MSKKKQTREKKTSIEDIYRNKNFVPPKEKNLETIFEEPRQSKDGVPILTSVKKYKRYLHFDPTQNKIQKRKRKAKKCFMKSSYQITRSSPKNLKCNDISMYILDALGDASDDSDMDISCTSSSIKTFGDTPSSANVDQSRKEEPSNSGLARDMSSSDLCGTPKRASDRPRSHKFAIDSDKDTDLLNNYSDDSPVNRNHIVDHQSNNISDDVEGTAESPRRSCCIS